jgi:ParB/RepB/Spo0J family partition protein
MEAGTFARIDVALIDEPARPLRDVIDSERLGELMDDIASNGLLQPVGVRGPSPADRFTIIWGHRRFLAVRALRWPSVEARVFPWSYDPLAAMAAENLQRADLNPVEEARLVKRMHEAGQPLAQIARVLRRGAAWVRERLDLLGYPEDVQSAVLAKHLTLAAAAELARVDHESYRLSLIEEAHRTGANAATVSLWVAHFHADRARIVSNEATVEEIFQRRESWTIHVMCDSCRVQVDYRSTRTYRFCSTCSAEVDAAIQGTPSPGDGPNGTQQGQATPRG